MSVITKEQAQEIRLLIADPKDWITGSPVDIDENGRKSYCLGGAVAQVLWDDANELYQSDHFDVLRLFAELAEIPLEARFCCEDCVGDSEMAPDTAIFTFNDEVGHEDVLAAIDKVIEKL